jgi:hypothetical protein
MAKSLVNTMCSKALYVLICGLALSLNATAQDAETDGQALAISTVDELLRLDAESAANNERQRYLLSLVKPHAASTIKTAPASQPSMAPVSAAPTPSPAPENPEPETPPEDQLALLGIFGFGQQLRADVSINGRRVRYQSGLSAPIDGPVVDGYKLLSLKTPCAVLANTKGSKTICIKRMASEG